jgi:tagatose 1,6-diphosphate aldolase
MKTLTLGKYRGLQQCSTPNGALSILALDHRNNLRAALRPEAPNSVGYAEMVAFKTEVIGALSPAATAVLLDPEFGVGPCITSGALAGRTGLLVATEASGYTGDPTARHSAILPGWGVEKVRKLGGSAVKILVYYHPESDTAHEIEAFVRKVAKDCQEYDLPLFVEPLSYSPDPAVKKLPPEERHRVVIETARKLTPLGVDILKAEFPLDASVHPKESEWAAACAELTEASAAPWVLLSAAVDFDTYLRQVVVALRAGASGVAVGRAVWQEATQLQGAERARFLSGLAHQRMARTTAVCDALGRPWTEVYAAPSIEVDWYHGYAA